MSLTWRTRPWFPLVVVALVGVMAALALLPGLRTAAQDPLGIFRVKRFAAVTLDPSTLPSPGGDPTALGSLTVHQAPTSTTVASLQEAQVLVDFTLRSPKVLPSGLEAAPKLRATREGRFSYTFDLQKARQYLASLGLGPAELPASLDGATLQLTLPAQVVAEYRAQAGSGATLVLGQGRSPILEAPPGLDVDQLRRQLLALPGLPPELTSQLQAIEDWQHTAVIPLPKGRASPREVTVDGARGLLVQGSAGEGQALLWEKGGVLYGMAGGLTAEDLMAAANSMSP